MLGFVTKRWGEVAWGAVALSVIGVQAACGQTIVVDRRGGTNLVYCGPFSGPLVVQHDFATAADVHDTISISDPGPPFNGGHATFDSSMSAAGITISLAGSSFRGAPLGFFHAVAGGSDSWSFTIDQPTCFTFSVSMRADSTSNPDQLQVYTISGPGLVPAPGTPPNTFSDSFFAPGAIERSGTGTFLPGSYMLNLNGRADANTFPYEASYAHSLALSIGPATLAGAPMSASSCAEGSATFSAAAQGAGPFTYQWRVESPADSGAYVDLVPGTFFEPSSGLTFEVEGATGAQLDVSDLDLGAHARVIRFVVRIANACGASTSEPAEWTICAGDLSCDDIIDFSDYLEFLNLFDAQDPRVDFNHDGVVDFGDYLEFLNLFDAGC